MGKIRLNNVRLHARHGCLKEESIIGSDYRVDAALEADTDPSSISDRLSETVDYVHVHRIIKEEMSIPSKLLEHVGNRILDRVFREIPLVDHVEVTVSKINPPIGGDVQSVSVTLERSR